jgi:hypothetical protein
MKSNLLYLVFTIAVFLLLHSIFQYLWLLFAIEITEVTQLISLMIIVLLLLPLSLVSAKKLTEHFLPKSNV